MALHEYVVVSVEELVPEGSKRVDVLAEVVRLGAKSPLAREGLSQTLPLSPDYARKYEYQVAGAEVLGYLENGRMLRPKSAPRPGTPVYRASDEVLGQFFSGDEPRLPVFVGSLIHRPNVRVPIHLQDLQFHLGIFAQTRAGKSYLAGKFMEEILLNTYFPVVVVDIHGDYVMMDQSWDGKKHGDFDVVVYYPPKAPKIPGITAETRELKISLEQVSSQAMAELLGALGPLQVYELRKVIKELRKENKPFGLADVISRLEEELEGEKSSDRKKRLSSLLMRLEDMGEDIDLPPESTPISDLLRPKTLSVICLRGLPDRMQDVYTGLIVDLVFRHMVKHQGDWVKAPPTFLFIEEAHRVASTERSKYATRAISTAIREGAKFGLHLALISQRPRSISSDIMANIGNYAVLRIVNRQDQLMIESASESFSHRLIEDLPSLNQGEAVLVGPFVPLPAQIKTLPRATVHRGITPRLLEANRVIMEAVESFDRERW